MEAHGGAGLGISFEHQQLQHDLPVSRRQQPRASNHGDMLHAGLHPQLAHLRPLRHAVSHDAGLRQYASAQPYPSYEDHRRAPYAYGKQVRIATGMPEVMSGLESCLPYDVDHLSPLSDLNMSAPSDSTSASSRPFSPMSMASLPSSTESGAYPVFPLAAGPPQPRYPIRHDNTVYSSRTHAVSHRDVPRQPRAERTPEKAQEQRRPSRMPAFLADRRHLGRPHSMVDLRQSQVEAALSSEPMGRREETVARHSPDRSALSSAAALQRQGSEPSDDQDVEVPPARQKMRQSEGRPRRRRLSHEEPASPSRTRSRSLSAYELRMLAEREAIHPASTAAGSEPDTEAGGCEEPRISVAPVAARSAHSEGAAGDEAQAKLRRQPTLLTTDASTVRRRKDLDQLLMPSHRFGAFGDHAAPVANRQVGNLGATSAPSPAVLEQAKSSSQARVELDLMLETPLVVEGGWLRGKLEVRVRHPRDREGELWLGKPKLRVVGFEELSSGEGRFIFFHHAATIESSELPSGHSHPLPCFASAADDEGFHRAKLGQHSMPVGMMLPAGAGAKGPWKGKSGVVRYIAIVSIKLKSQTGTNRSIAHFYRDLDVFPYLDPALALAPALQPLSGETSKSLFMGGSGQVLVRASIHRRTWVAGQRCYVDVTVENGSNKKIKTLNLSLIRTTATYRSGGRTDGNRAALTGKDAASGQMIQSVTKRIAEANLELGKKSSSGPTAKGTWLGVEAGTSASFSPTIVIPPDALTLHRGRHFEVSYVLRVAASASLAADVSAEVPLEIINFVSLDPPPGHVGRTWDSMPKDATERQSRAAPMRMSSMDSLRLDDLDGIHPMSCQKAPALSRVPSLESIQTIDLPRDAPVVDDPRGHRVQHIEHSEAPSVGLHDVPENSQQQQAILERARQRQLRHQMSLQCISGAIASATARRNSPRSSPGEPAPKRSGSNDEAAHDLFLAGAQRLPSVGAIVGGDGLGIQLDDLDDFDAFNEGGDVPSYLPASPPPAAAAEGLARLVVSGEAGGDGRDALTDALLATPTHALHVRVTPPTPFRAFQAATRGEKPQSPVKAKATQRQTQTPEKYAFATPTSPIKVGAEQVASVRGDSSGTRPNRPARPLPMPPAAASMVRNDSNSSTDDPATSRTALRKVPSGTSLKRSPGMLRKASSAHSLRSVAGASSSPGSSRTLARSPSLASPQVSPVLASGTTATFAPDPMHSSPLAPTPEEEDELHDVPRRVLAPVVSPALRATRSMVDLHGASRRAPSSPRKPIAPPVVKVKVAALESRQSALTRLATQTGAGSVSARARDKDSAGLSRADSTASSVAPSEFNLKRADSMASFKAPLFRRGFEELPPPVPFLPRHRA